MNWKQELSKNITTIAQLKKYIPLSFEEEEQFHKIIKLHPMSITRYYMSLIDKNYPHDPIRKMVVPSLGELNMLGSYDPCGELDNTKMPGLQHKYAQTAFILVTNRCSSYCRHCFRKRLVGLPSEEILKRFGDAVEYIKDHREVNNVLLSGGDPFVLPSGVIENFLAKLSDIPQLDFIRFGTRTLVTFPDRVLMDDELLDVLRKYSYSNRRIYVVTQFNHPKEITEKSTEAIAKLIDSNVVLSNQAVLLKDVNDDPNILAELQNGLVNIGVNPYYVFQCRPVKRVKSNFQVPLLHGYRIIEDAKKRLNGHSKRFRYVMSHKLGKIEIIGISGNIMYFKFHQAKNPQNIGKLFKRRINETGGWLDDLEKVDVHPSLR